MQVQLLSGEKLDPIKSKCVGQSNLVFYPLVPIKFIVDGALKILSNDSIRPSLREVFKLSVTFEKNSCGRQTVRPRQNFPDFTTIF